MHFLRFFWFCVVAAMLLQATAVQAQRNKTKKEGDKKTEKKTSTKANSNLPPGSELSEADRRRTVDVLFFDAATLQSQQNAQEALTKYQAIIKLDPKHHASYYGIAAILLEENQPNQALPFAQEALRLDPTNLWYYNALAIALEKTGQPAKSAEVLEQAVKRFPNELDLRFKLVETYFGQRNFEKALTLLDSLEKRTGLVEELELQKMRIFIRSGQADKAIATGRRLIELFPEDTKFYLILADAHREFRQFDKVAEVLQELLKQDPENNEALFGLVQFYTSQNKPTEARKYLERAFNSASVPLEAKVSYIASLMPLFGVNDSVQKQVHRYTDILLQQNKSSAQVLALKANLFARSNQMDSAQVYYRRSIAIDGTNRGVWEELVQADMTPENGKPTNWEVLLKDVNNALEIFPSNVFFNYAAGWAYYSKKDYNSAQWYLDKVTKIGTSDINLLNGIYTLLGDVYHYLSDGKRSDESFEKALEIDPSNALTLNNYAYFLSVRGERLEYALKMIKKVMDDPLNAGNASYQDTYGWIFFKMGNYKDALTWIEKAYNQGGDAGGEVAEHLGDVNYMLGNKERAQQLWKEAQAKQEKNGDKNATLAEKIRTGTLKL
jgi:tetratricopeptide (TPR) repeat protein